MWLLEWTPTWFTFLIFIPPQGLLSKGICRLNRISPDFQNPHFKAKEKPITWEKVPVMADEGWWIKALPRFSAIVCVSPSSPGGCGFFDGRMDSATSPLAPRRMTGWGGLGERVIIYLRDADHKGV